MVDFHSHILPGMDDGSASVSESLEMLALSRGQGVEQIVASSHYYAAKEPPERFLRRRDAAWEQLSPSLPENAPRIHLGAEVYYFSGISRAEEVPALCIAGTDVLLLEMPFARWSGRMVDEILSLSQDAGLTVLLAHIDRYFASQPEDIWETLHGEGILFQVNADYFLGGFFAQRKAVKQLREGLFHVIGSDCHNMGQRKPNLALAEKVFEKNHLGEAQQSLRINALRLLGQG